MNDLTLIIVLAVVYGILGAVLLAIVIGGSNRRRRKDPVRALSGTLPPENEAQFEYTPSLLLFLVAFCAAFMSVLALISPVAFPGSPIPAWVSIGMPVLLVVCVVLLVYSWGRKLTFDEKELTVNKCGILYDGNQVTAKKQSFTLAWNEIASVDYSSDNLVVITTTDGRRMGIRTFLYQNGSMRGCNSVEIGMRIDYYMHYFGRGEQDIERMPKKKRFPIEVDALFGYVAIGLVLVFAISALGDNITDTDYDPNVYLETAYENCAAQLPVEIDSTITFSDVQLDDEYYTWVFECNENYINMDSVQMEIDQTPEDIIDLDDPDMAQLLSALKETNTGLRMQYVGTTSGKTATLSLEPDEF